MKFCGEVQSLNSAALQIGGESVKLAARVGEVAFIELGDDDAAALRADFQAVEIGGGALQRVISVVQAVNQARMRGIVQTLAAQEKIQVAKSLRDAGEASVVLRAGAMKLQSRAVLRRGARAGRLGKMLFVRQECGSQLQEARLSLERHAGSSTGKARKKSESGKVRIEEERCRGYSTTRAIWLGKGYLL